MRRCSCPPSLPLSHSHALQACLIHSLHTPANSTHQPCLPSRRNNPACLPAFLPACQASCWGVSWYQPFVVLPSVTAVAAAAGAAAREAVRPQGVFTVVVQPPLPLLKVCARRLRTLVQRRLCLLAVCHAIPFRHAC